MSEKGVIKTTLGKAAKLHPHIARAWLDNQGEKHWDSILTNSPYLNDNGQITVMTTNNHFFDCDPDFPCFVQLQDYDGMILELESQLVDLQNKKEQLQQLVEWLDGDE